MKNRVKIRTVLLIAVIYLFAASWVSTAGQLVGLGSGLLLAAIAYAVLAIVCGSALLNSDLADAARDVETFHALMPLRRLGVTIVQFQHVFFHDGDLLEPVVQEIDSRLVARSFIPKLRPKNYTDIDKRLRTHESREFLLSMSEPNRRGTHITLALHLRRNNRAQSVQWWVLTRGDVDRNKRFALLAASPLALPFWIVAKVRRRLDLASSVRTVHDTFYNEVDVIADVRSLHTLVMDALVDTLERYGVDTSDLKQQRAQALTINVTGGKARFGNVVQALRQAKVQTGGAR